MAKVEGETITMAGVTKVDQRAGLVSVVLEEGGNVATLTVTDGDGNSATVFIGWQQTSMIMTHLGAAGMRM